MFFVLDVSCIKHIYKKHDLYSEKCGLYVIFGQLGGVSVNSLYYLHLVKIDDQSFNQVDQSSRNWIVVEL